MFGSQNSQSIVEDGRKTLQNACKRWLTACEISRVLAYATTAEGAEALCVAALPLRPASGSIFVLDYDKKRAKWKEDGYSYERRPNDVGFKEHSERIGDDKKIVCLYSSVSNTDPAYEEQQHNPGVDLKFQRRIYRHVDLEPRLLLVHYFMSRKLKKVEATGGVGEAQSESTWAAQNRSEGPKRSNGGIPSNICSLSQKEIAVSQAAGSRVKPAMPGHGSVGCLESSSVWNCGSSQNNQPLLSFWSDKDDESLSAQLGMHIEESGADEALNTPSGRSGSGLAGTEVSKPSLFMTGEERISALERQIELLKRQLEQERSVFSGKSTSLANDSASREPEKIPAEHIEAQRQKSVRVFITDFSPEWDYLEGGAKVILCLKVTPGTKAGAKAVVYFGDYATDGMMIQDNVLRCYGKICCLTSSSLSV